MVCLKQTIKQAIPLHIFERLSSRNFTWSILEYFVPYLMLVVVVMVYKVDCFFIPQFTAGAGSFFKLKFEFLAKVLILQAQFKES